MSAPAPLETEKVGVTTSGAGQSENRDRTSPSRVNLSEQLRRTDGHAEQEKLIEPDRGPEPSPEVAAEIAAEQDATKYCAKGADTALLVELLTTEARVRPLINGINDTARTTIAQIAATMKASAGEVVGWANRENKALIELFSHYAASLEGGGVNGDVLAIASIANMFNPAAKLKTIVSIVMTGAGFVARDYNRQLAAWRKSETGKELTQTANRIEGTGEAQIATWHEMFDRMAAGSLEVTALTFQAGRLDGALSVLQVPTERLRASCRDGRAATSDMTAIVQGQLTAIRSIEAEAKEHLALMRTLPTRMAAENRAGLDRMKTRYITWLAGQGAIKVRGRLYVDQQAGADVLHIALDQVIAIEGLEASGFAAETAQTICGKPGRLLAAGGTLALSLASVIHGQRSDGPISDNQEREPSTFQGDLHFRVGPKGVEGTAFGYALSLDRIEALLRARQ